MKIQVKELTAEQAVDDLITFIENHKNAPDLVRYVFNYLWLEYPEEVVMKAVDVYFEQRGIIIAKIIEVLRKELKGGERILKR